MKRHLTMIGSLSLAICLAAPAPAEPAGSWVFRQSRYSHDPATGRHVDQFAPKAPSLAEIDPYYVRSGYRHKRSTLRGADGSADRLHLVETWGAGDSIRPYGEWLFPFRAGATPYGPWGNPQGPWTMPFDSWINPYGTWNRYPLYGSPYPAPYGHGGGPDRGHKGHPRHSPHGPPPGHSPHAKPFPKHGFQYGHGSPHAGKPHPGSPRAHEPSDHPHPGHSPTGPHGAYGG